MFNRFKKKLIEKRLKDEILFEYVLDELEDDIKVKGLWAKAYANSEGDKNKIEPLYMQYRVQSIKDIFTSIKIAYEELPKERISKIINNKSKKISSSSYRQQDIKKEEKKSSSDYILPDRVDKKRALEIFIKMHNLVNLEKINDSEYNAMQENCEVEILWNNKRSIWRLYKKKKSTNINIINYLENYKF